MVVNASNPWFQEAEASRSLSPRSAGNPVRLSQKTKQTNRLNIEQSQAWCHEGWGQPGLHRMRPDHNGKLKTKKATGKGPPRPHKH